MLAIVNEEGKIVHWGKENKPMVFSEEQKHTANHWRKQLTKNGRTVKVTKIDKISEREEVNNEGWYNGAW